MREIYVGNYRVIYQVQPERVLILAVVMELGDFQGLGCDYSALVQRSSS
jgi:hypothetical protein